MPRICRGQGSSMLHWVRHTIVLFLFSSFASLASPSNLGHGHLLGVILGVSKKASILDDSALFGFLFYKNCPLAGRENCCVVPPPLQIYIVHMAICFVLLTSIRFCVPAVCSPFCVVWMEEFCDWIFSVNPFPLLSGFHLTLVSLHFLAVSLF